MQSPWLGVERELAHLRQLPQLGAGLGRLVTAGVRAWPPTGWLVAGERCRPMHVRSADGSAVAWGSPFSAQFVHITRKHL